MTKLGSEFHIPVMVNEVISYLIPSKPLLMINDKQPMFIDATVGGGGHAQALLEKVKHGIVIGLDCDVEAIDHTKSLMKKYNNFYLFHADYTDIDKIISEFPNHYVQGVLFDLGVSYYQIMTPHRGFSYNSDGPLDMRFNQSKHSKTAKEIIWRSPLPELKRIFVEYGEERFANKIATHLFNRRHEIRTASDLSESIKQIIPSYKQNKTLARIFQALRIAVNQELENIKLGLKKAIQIMSCGARIVVISYHSLEDRIVKQMFRKEAEMKILKILTKKPLCPEPVEVLSNSSARSARFRASEKI